MTRAQTRTSGCSLRTTLLTKVPFPDGDRLVLLRTYPEWNPALSNAASKASAVTAVSPAARA